MLDREGVKELSGRTPKERPHRSVVRVGVMDGELSGEILEGEETTGGVEAPLVLSVATFHLAVMPWCVRTNELVADAQLSGGFLKQGRDVPLAFGKPIGKLKAIVGLNALNRDAPSSIPLDEPFGEIGRGIGGLFQVRGKEA